MTKSPFTPLLKMYSKKFNKVLASSNRSYTLRLAACLSCIGFTGTVSAANFSTNSLQQYIQTQKTVKKAAPNSPQAKMGAALLDSVRSGSSKSIRDKLPLLIKATPNSGYALVNELRANGVQVQSQIGDDIYAFAYNSQLNSIAEIRYVQSISFQPKISISVNPVDDLLSQIGLGNDNANLSTPSNNSHRNQVPNVNDEGNLSIYAKLFHDKGYYGDNIKVGIIDFGYNGYDTLKAKGVLPNPINTATFINDSKKRQLNTTSGTPHGTACAEIIYNLAPNASYYLAQIGDGEGNAGSSDLVNAIDWMVSQGVNVINFSGGGHGEQHNGHATLDKKVEQVAKKGILWINAAGNEGEDHWGGTLSDRNHNGLIDLNGYDYLELESLGYPFKVTFNWDDWGDTSPYENIDLDAYILNTEGKVVARQEVARNPKTPAVDFLYSKLPKGRYALALSTTKSSPKKLHVLVQGAKLIDIQSQGSIGIPATSKAALSVGAWDVITKDIANYSSRGKTDDNRIKPEISAPTNVLSNSYRVTEGKKRFQGTSASAPYATGFATLVWSANPQWSAEATKKYLKNQAVRPLGRTVPNINSGYGILDARRVVGKLNSQNYNSPSNSNSNQPSNVTQNPNGVQDLLNSIGF